MAEFGGYIGTYSNIFLACGNTHMEAYGGIIGLGLSNTIQGSATNCMLSTRKGTINAAQTSLTFAGSPNFSDAFIHAEYGSFIEAGTMTFHNTGVVTGQRWCAQTGGILQTDGSNPDTYFPGNSPGIVDSSTFGMFV